MVYYRFQEFFQFLKSLYPIAWDAALVAEFAHRGYKQEHLFLRSAVDCARHLEGKIVVEILPYKICLSYSAATVNRYKFGF